MKACYIHIPFCENICSYCDFAKMYYNPEQSNNYLFHLKQEISSRYNGELLDTIYIGGGTPSALTINELKRLFEIIDLLQFNTNYEFTFEANPESLTLEKLELLQSKGVNRLSIGVQTFNERLLKLIQRNHSVNDIHEVIQNAKKVGFTNINVDLIFSLPTQTIDEVKEDLQLFLQLDVPHISTYSLILEDHTLFKVKNIELQDEDTELEMFELIMDTLKNNGYIHYEISNFAKSGYESKHNLTYWNNDEYYGFGLGAHGYEAGIRKENTKSIQEYNKGNYLKSETILTKNEQMEEHLFLGLRKLNGVSISQFKERFNLDLVVVFPQVQSLIEKNLIEMNDDFLRLTNKGLMLGNNVFEAFLID